MAKAIYMINQLPEFQGSRFVRYSEATADAVRALVGYDVEVIEADEQEVVVKGALGHPVIMPLKLERTKYETKLNGQPIKAVIPELMLTTAVIAADVENIIEMTPVEGTEGTVKEYSSRGDWKVNIDVLLIDEDDNYPEQQLKHLMEFVKAPVAIEVSCSLLLHLEVTRLSIKRAALTPMVGIQGAQAIQLECYSDLQLELKLKGEL